MYALSIVSHLYIPVTALHDRPPYRWENMEGAPFGTLSWRAGIEAPSSHFRHSRGIFGDAFSTKGPHGLLHRTIWEVVLAAPNSKIALNCKGIILFYIINSIGLQVQQIANQ